MRYLAASDAPIGLVRSDIIWHVNGTDGRFFVVVMQPGTALRLLVEAVGSVTAGRDATNAVLLAHPLVSRQHARFSLRDGRFVVEDLASRNGTVVNGRPAAGPVAVEEPATVQIGPFVLSLSTTVADETLTAAQQSAGPPRAMLDRVRRQLHIDGVLALDTLSPNEFALLELLALRQPGVVQRTDAGNAVWGAEQWDIYMLHNLVSRLRRRIPQHEAQEPVIVTIPGVGYRLA